MLFLVGALIATWTLACPCAHMVRKCVCLFFLEIKGNKMISFNLLKDIVLSWKCNYSSSSLLGFFLLMNVILNLIFHDMHTRELNPYQNHLVHCNIKLNCTKKKC
jgi:hypothetical protein